MRPILLPLGLLFILTTACSESSTKYAGTYAESKFDSLAIGSRLDDALRVLGPPLSRSAGTLPKMVWFSPPPEPCARRSAYLGFPIECAPDMTILPGHVPVAGPRGGSLGSTFDGGQLDLSHAARVIDSRDYVSLDYSRPESGDSSYELRRLIVAAHVR